MLKINRLALISRHRHHFSSRLLSSFGNIYRNKSSVSVNDALQKNEEDEIAELQKKKLQELKILEEKKKREEENRERMKLKRFMEM